MPTVSVATDIASNEILSCGLSESLATDSIGLCDVEDSDLEVYDEPEVDSEESPNAFSLPLYEGAAISVFESHMLLFQYAVRHSLTSKAFSELLQIISVHVPSPSKVPKSVHRLKNFFLKLFPQAKCKVHPYCSACFSLVATAPLMGVKGVLLKSS